MSTVGVPWPTQWRCNDMPPPMSTMRSSAKGGGRSGWTTAAFVAVRAAADEDAAGGAFAESRLNGTPLRTDDTTCHAAVTTRSGASYGIDAACGATTCAEFLESDATSATIV